MNFPRLRVPSAPPPPRAVQDSDEVGVDNGSQLQVADCGRCQSMGIYGTAIRICLGERQTLWSGHVGAKTLRRVVLSGRARKLEHVELRTGRSDSATLFLSS